MQIRHAAIGLGVGAVVGAIGLSAAALADLTGEPPTALAAAIPTAAASTTTTSSEAADYVIEPVMLLTKRGKSTKDKRGDRFVQVSATGSNDVPEAALRAYRNAARTLGETKPGCQIPWTLLAAIGRVESDHGRYGGATLGQDGVSRPEILGVPLNGEGPVAAIRDTDHGRLDHDKVWDRAVGQMQFIPSTWAVVGADGDHDGKRDPNDLDDSALAAGNYLCAGGSSVADSAGAARAVYSYNHSDYYVALVLAFERGYETGVFVIPSPPVEGADGTGKHKGKKHKSSSGHGQGNGKGGAEHGPKQPGDKGKGDSGKGDKNPPPPKPTHKPTPKPTPTPAAPQLERGSGVFTACPGGYCWAGKRLDVGPDSQLDRKAAADYDGDGTLESNRDEFDGLVLAGTTTPLGYAMRDGRAVVYVVDGHDYRFADGSFA